MGIVSCFSFYANKIITTGEGGICLTNNEELADKIRVLKSHGMSSSKRYWHDVIGYNYHITNMQAAMGLAQLEKIDRLIEFKRRIARLYNEFLEELDLELHQEPPWGKSVYWLYSVVTKASQREKLVACLSEHGVETRRFFYPLHIMPAFKEFMAEELSEAEVYNSIYLHEHGINLPSGYNLTDEDIEYIANLVKEALRKA